MAERALSSTGPMAERRRGRRAALGRRRQHWLTHIALIVGAALMVSPFVWQILTSLKTFGESFQVPPTVIPKVWDFRNYGKVFRSMPFASMIITSVVVTAVRTSLSVLLSAVAAYAFSRLRFRGQNALFLMFLSMLMVPSELFIIPRYVIMSDLHWLNTLQALFTPGIFSVFGVFLLRQFFMTLPRELDEAGRIDGANPPRLFWHLMLPLARPGLIALGIIEMLAAWKEFLWPLIVNTDPSKMPLSAGLATLQGEFFTNYPVLMAGSFIAMVPIIALFAVMQRQFIQGIAFSGNKG